MQQITAFPPPLQPGAPPSGYAWSERALSGLSTTTGFNRGLDARDVFLGDPGCIICGKGDPLQHCHIMPKAEVKTWLYLQRQGWLPRLAKDNPDHEPRNGLKMCLNHHKLFDDYSFFIRFFPAIRKFVLIDYSDRFTEDIIPYHGKAVALDIGDRHAPLPFTIYHTRNARAIDWQDWIKTRGVWNDTRGQFNRDGSGASGLPQMPSMTPINTSGGGEPSTSGTQRLEFNDKVLADILAATYAMPSWKKCEMEGTMWTGTAEENKEKYLSIVQNA